MEKLNFILEHEGNLFSLENATINECIKLAEQKFNFKGQYNLISGVNGNIKMHKEYKRKKDIIVNINIKH